MPQAQVANQWFQLQGKSLRPVACHLQPEGKNSINKLTLQLCGRII